MKKSKKVIMIIYLTAIIILLILRFTSTEIYDTSYIYGFWKGLGNGMISAFTLIWKIFDPSVSVYHINNNGVMYDWGFLVGVTVFPVIKNVIANKY